MLLIFHFMKFFDDFVLHKKLTWVLFNKLFLCVANVRFCLIAVGFVI